MATTSERLAVLAAALVTETAVDEKGADEVVASAVTSHCCKCGKELTDAASIEAGIGPECRKLANETLATLIPANVEAAREALAAVDAKYVHKVARPTLAKVVAEITAGTTNDYRETVKRIAWVVSTGTGALNVNALYTVIEKLGYLAFSNVLRGVVVSGKASVAVENGRIVLRSPRPKAAALDATRAVKGRKFHAAGELGEKAAWSFPVTEVKAVWELLSNYYPNNDASFVKLVAECKKAERVLVETAPVKSAPSVTVTPGAYDGVKIVSPYNAAFVGAIKCLPYNERKWLAAEKAWWVSAAKKAEALTLIEKFYGEGAVKAA